MAETFLLFNEIPETEGNDDFVTLDQVHLKLSRPTINSKIIFFYYKNVILLNKMLYIILHFKVYD